MSFSSDIKKFSTKVSFMVDVVEKEQQSKITSFLKDFLGDEYSSIKSISFDNDLLKFYDVIAPETVIEKLKKANYLR